jgi:hypothetical protein
MIKQLANRTSNPECNRHGCRSANLAFEAKIFEPVLVHISIFSRAEARQEREEGNPPFPDLRLHLLGAQPFEG